MVKRLTFKFIIFCLFCTVASAEALLVQLEQQKINDITETISKKSINLPKSEAITNFLEKSQIFPSDVREFLLSFDKYSSYDDKNELEFKVKFREVFDSGLGMNIIKNKAGEYICLPYPDQIADKAGILENDVLQFIDDFNIKLNSLDEIMALLLGKEGTKVVLGVKRDNSVIFLDMNRGKIHAPDIEFIEHENFTRIRFWNFSNNTVEKFEHYLAKIKKFPLVIDLRGNTGGNLMNAKKCISLLLPQNSLIGNAITRNQDNSRKTNKSYSSNGKFAHINEVYFWQDGLTASASEVFISALVDNNKALSMGVNSYGKAHAQTVFNYEGDRLVLSTDELQTPKGFYWEDQGLSPKFICETFDSYVEQSNKLALEYKAKNIDNQIDDLLQLPEQESLPQTDLNNNDIDEYEQPESEPVTPTRQPKYEFGFDMKDKIFLPK